MGEGAELKGLTPSESGVVALLCLGFVLGMAVKTIKERWRPVVTVQTATQEVEDSSARANAMARFRVDINQASVQELESLPGIGPVMARRIIEYRQENGPFCSIEALDHVKGIGEKTIERIRSRIIIDR